MNIFKTIISIVVFLCIGWGTFKVVSMCWATITRTVIRTLFLELLNVLIIVIMMILLYKFFYLTNTDELLLKYNKYLVDTNSLVSRYDKYYLVPFALFHIVRVLLILLFLNAVVQIVEKLGIAVDEEFKAPTHVLLGFLSALLGIYFLCTIMYLLVYTDMDDDGMFVFTYNVYDTPFGRAQLAGHEYWAEEEVRRKILFLKRDYVIGFAIISQLHNLIFNGIVANVYQCSLVCALLISTLVSMYLLKRGTYDFMNVLSYTIIGSMGMIMLVWHETRTIWYNKTFVAKAHIAVTNTFNKIITLIGYDPLEFGSLLNYGETIIQKSVLIFLFFTCVALLFYFVLADSSYYLKNKTIKFCIKTSIGIEFFILIFSIPTMLSMSIDSVIICMSIAVMYIFIGVWICLFILFYNHIILPLLKKHTSSACTIGFTIGITIGVISILLIFFLL